MSKYAITIGGDDRLDFLAQFEWIAQHFGFVRSNDRTVDDAGDYMPHSDDVGQDPTASAPKSRRGRPPKSAAAPQPVPEQAATEQASLIDEESKPEAQPEAKSLTLDDAKEAGRLLVATGKIERLRIILKQFAVAKVADLKPLQFEDFIAECKKAAV